MRRCAHGLLVLLALAVVGFELKSTVAPGLPEWAFGQIANDVCMAVAAVLCLLRARGAARAERSGWAALAASLLLWVAGDLDWILSLDDQQQVPIPSWADAGYLAFVPLSFAALVLLAKARLRNVPSTLWLDGLIAALASAAVGATLVFGAVTSGTDGSRVAIAVNLTYAVGDLALLALIVAAIALRGWRVDRTWGLLALGVIAFWVSDSLYLVTNANGTYQAGAWFDVGWSVAAICFAAAAWLPEPVVAVVEPKAEDPRIAALPALFGLASLGLLVDRGGTGGNVAAGMLAGASLLVVFARLLVASRLNATLLASTRQEAETDALTGLRNRRRLVADLERTGVAATAGRRAMLVIFDLDGFKHYNDTLGHPAGDALLQRAADRLAATVAGVGTPYRMGGDEFCLLVHGVADAGHPIVRRAVEALGEAHETFAIRASFGVVVLPEEARTGEEALRVADLRMYEQKRGGRASTGEQTARALRRALTERDPDLGHHTTAVVTLAEAVARRLGLAPVDVQDVRRAAELHDVGKLAMPDALLLRRSPVDEHEWRLLRRQALVGEQIVGAAPALERVARLVRSVHEHVDGTGYPDGLSGSQIPLAARIVAVCDAFDALTGPGPFRLARPLEAALAELDARAGTELDPAVVDALAEVVTGETAPVGAEAPLVAAAAVAEVLPAAA